VDIGREQKLEFAADLYLTWACVDHCAAAHKAIESEYFPAVRSALMRLLGQGPVVDDVMQDMRARLFVGESPRIASYRGAGPLSGWLRRVAANAAQDWLRSRNTESSFMRRSLADQWFGRDNQASSEELERHAFRVLNERNGLAAWMTGIAALSASERKLLHHYFVSGLSIDVLGAMYGVHRATIARRVRRAVGRVKQVVRNALSSLSDQELQTLMLQTSGGLDLSSLLESGTEVRWSEDELETSSAAPGARKVHVRSRRRCPCCVFDVKTVASEGH